MPQFVTVDLYQLIRVLSVGEILAAVAAGIVLKRIGFSAWWALLCLVPVAAILALWLLAFIRWPRDAVQPQPG